MYSREEVEQVAIGEAFQKRTPEQYLMKAGEMMQVKLAANPYFYQEFGPYSGLVYDALAGEDLPRDDENGWTTQPDYLSPDYDLGEPALNMVAAMMYLNKDGISTGDTKHSVVLADGSEALYVPGVGIVES